MRIGIVTTWFERGAAYVSKIFEDVLKKDNNVFIYARGGEEYAKNSTEWNKPNVHWGNLIISPFSSTVINKKDLIKWINANNIELIIFNEQHWWEPILWCKELNIKTISYIDYYREDTIPFFDLYDALICNTKRHYSAFASHKNVIYLPWGTDIGLFKPKQNELVNEEFVTFFHSCGWDIYRKGTDILIKAFRQSQKAKKLIIHSQNEIDNEELKPILDELISEGRLELIIKTVSAPGLYHLGDVYVYPTRLEGIGLTVPEALACGLGIVIPNNAPMNEFADTTQSKLIEIDRFIARKDGYYWPKCECNTNSLVDILDSLAENKDLIKTMKFNARKYAEKHLDVNTNFSELNKFVNNVNFSNPTNEQILKIKEFEKTGFKIFHKPYLRYYSLFNKLRKIIKKYDL